MEFAGIFGELRVFTSYFGCFFRVNAQLEPGKIGLASSRSGPFSKTF